jgi:hypothetical protein
VARPHPASLDGPALLAQCERSKGRSGGPGGQHRNKVETLVRLVHTPTGVEAHAGERRSAVENERVAIFRLRLALAREVRCAVPEGDQRSTLWRGRCDARGRVACNPEHHDYPALLAEALDMVCACGLDVPRAALRLACTTSQLVGLLRDDPHSLAMVNAARLAAGLHAIR